MSKKEGKLDFIREIIKDDIASKKHESIITRFPPEPNGFLHIGHAKAICLNFGLAQEYAQIDAKCHLRFDDTNPVKEEARYVDSIKEDISWLGFDWGENLYFASNYFDFFYECAQHLIKNGLAYVDTQTGDEIRQNRGNVQTPGTHSPFRDRPAEESLELFAKMKAGDFADGEAVLRAKIDMSSSNMNMRDPILYRVLHTEHHNTGGDWCIYPMYDFAHPLEDAHEHITHSLCSLEFENHRPLYDWVVENCPTPSKPRQIEFARLNLNYTVMSKRKLLELVEDGLVSGWDDPRLPTLSGLRRRGYPAASIRSFCQRIGMTKYNGITDVALLEYEVRNELNASAPRRMAVLDPLKVVITNWEKGHSEEMELPNNPNDKEAGTRKVTLGREVWIERDDFMIDPPKKFFRLGPGRSVRLRGGYIITCHAMVKCESTGEVSEIHCEYIPDTVGKNAPEGIKCKAAIHWVSVEHGLDAEVRQYDRLFLDENPDAHEDGFKAAINGDSLKVISTAKVEPSLGEFPAEASCQFERLGYYCTDRVDHTPAEKLVFNLTVSLKDSWAKKK
ncbi:glutamine--tRNA ligase/YqeY domain fusion protein [Persicirhabdus sediminis]|uniref:Glutamine--tRNA ligase n=1 Tax=Persicirhabdus sediminis TaxID=454144 RepID=A0A8J7MDB3_9BACT|nr:glutamine--tRNA ligase/YqeY domain fusion protein [Persicirhabdus sediminis]MBK1791312.1 glutamine--tRNA ligase/YqeY domain fusion protein [Persicirhabdus sediminis]